MRSCYDECIQIRDNTTVLILAEYTMKRVGVKLLLQWDTLGFHCCTQLQIEKKGCAQKVKGCLEILELTETLLPYNILECVSTFLSPTWK